MWPCACYLTSLNLIGKMRTTSFTGLTGKSNQIMNVKPLAQLNKWQVLWLFWGKEEGVRWVVSQNILWTVTTPTRWIKMYWFFRCMYAVRSGQKTQVLALTLLTTWEIWGKLSHDSDSVSYSVSVTTNVNQRSGRHFLNVLFCIRLLRPLMILGLGWGWAG